MISTLKKKREHFPIFWYIFLERNFDIRHESNIKRSFIQKLSRVEIFAIKFHYQSLKKIYLYIHYILRKYLYQCWKKKRDNSSHFLVHFSKGFFENKHENTIERRIRQIVPKEEIFYTEFYYKLQRKKSIFLSCIEKYLYRIWSKKVNLSHFLVHFSMVFFRD